MKSIFPLLFLFIFSIIHTTKAQYPLKIDSLYKEANWEQNHSNPKKAISIYSKILKKYPNHFLAINNRSLCYNTLGKYDKAIAGYDHLMQLDSTQGLIYLNKAMTLANLQQYENAYKSYLKAEKLKGTRLDLLYYNMAILFSKWEHQYDSTIHYNKLSILHNPNFIEAYNNLIFAYINNEQWDEAVAYGKHVIDKQKPIAPHYNNLGYAYMKLGQFENALHYLNLSQEMFPKNTWCDRNLGLTYKEMGDADKACQHLKASLKKGFIKEWGQAEIQELIDYCNLHNKKE
ncbi:MAG: hypothetical protein CL843_00725 [Crocinitomicaceae bacterium]|nr:hypothetical protein [Crocinitomicaceae bacterium]|tara:strand:- start:1360 stop:2223 length:864 start_codon:yes stop_codon:yes gene_type:complete